MARSDGVKGKFDGTAKGDSFESDSFSKREISDVDKKGVDPRDAWLFEKKFSEEKRSDGNADRGRRGLFGDHFSKNTAPSGAIAVYGDSGHVHGGEDGMRTDGTARTGGESRQSHGGAIIGYGDRGHVHAHEGGMRTDGTAHAGGESRQPHGGAIIGYGDRGHVHGHEGGMRTDGTARTGGESRQPHGGAIIGYGDGGHVHGHEGGQHANAHIGEKFIPRVTRDSGSQNQILGDGAVKNDSKLRDSRNNLDRENDHRGAIPAISGNVILDNMQTMHIDPTSSEAAGIIKNLGVQVAEKIIATYEALNAKQEVRITLQENLLKDTEVVISKDGGRLNVTFMTGSDESASILNHRSGDLRSQLMERLADVNSVEIEVEQQNQNASDNQNRDGRSQNRFGNEQQDEENPEQQ
ncbi:MAG: flagellar hook-length control protein FliK [Puniceicoccales bacterium]|jgi:type III secretion system needle length determinant|nr:flagellar hook-length control protein FliK [Puniceicoccales bacterium]